jgi:hypothetical protein
MITFQEGIEMRTKLQRIIRSFGAKIWDYQEQDMQRKVGELQDKIDDTKKLLKDTNRELRNYLIRLNDLEAKRNLGGNSPFYGISTIPMYKMFVLSEEEIYRNMNCL